MQRKPKLGARFTHAPFYSAIHMDLPLERREWREVVFARCELDPRESISAMYSPRSARAQRAATIVDARLRYRLEQEATHCSHSKKEWYHEGKGSLTHQTRESTTLRDERKSAIRSRDEPPSKGNSLWFIGVEQLLGRALLHDLGELPRPVHCLAHSGVRSLSADPTLDLRSFAAPLARVLDRRYAKYRHIGRTGVYWREIVRTEMQEALDGLARRFPRGEGPWRRIRGEGTGS